MSEPICVTIVFMGDSITEGQYVEGSSRWTHQVSAALNLKYLKSSVNLLFVSRGISGETTRQGLERFPADVQNLQPDVMTLQYGLNDCNCWVTDRGLPRVSEPAYRANLIEMIDRARAFGAGEVVLSTNHQTLRHKVLLSGESLETRRKRYNEVVRKVAAETGVTLCDIDGAFADYSFRDMEAYLVPYPDHLHLSPAGHRIYADTIQPFIERAIERVIASRENETS